MSKDTDEDDENDEDDDKKLFCDKSYVVIKVVLFSYFVIKVI